jgi:linoleoyl-CoA desaturase
VFVNVKFTPLKKHMAAIQFNTKDHPFFDALKKKVDNYFAEKEIKPSGNWRLYSKTIILVSTFFALYGILVFVSMPVWLSIALCVVFGINIAAIGFNVMHDGAHGSFSSKSWVNNIMGYSLNVMGGDVNLWKIKHNLIHHSFTNIDGLDDDIDIRPFMRTTVIQPKLKMHRWQHVYSIVLYSLTYVLWIFYFDFKKYFSRKIGLTPIRKFSVKNHIVFWVTKLVHFTFFIGLPIYTLGVLATILGYIIVTFVCGIILAYVFQMAHVMENTEFVDPNAAVDGKLEDEWAVHQIKTTTNFATQSRVVSWLTGGLNYQVEHHLFPRISHVHYPEINKLVKETCDQFGVRYNEYKTVVQALKSHVNHLRLVGKAA